MHNQADYFNLGHIGSISFITHQVRAMKNENRAFQQVTDEVIASIIKKAT